MRRAERFQIALVPEKICDLKKIVTRQLGTRRRSLGTECPVTVWLGCSGRGANEEGQSLSLLCCCFWNNSRCTNSGTMRYRVSYCRWMDRYDTKVITTRTGNTGSSEESGENWDKELWDKGGEGRVDETRLFWALFWHLL